MKRTIYIIIGAILVIGLVIGGVMWQNRRNRAAETENMRIVTAERSTLLVAVSASGSIEPEARIDLTFQTPGTVDEVSVAVGDTVQAGDVLAQLDTTDLAFAVQQAEIQLQSAELRLEQIQDPADEADVAIAQAAVSDAAAAYETAQLNLTVTENSVSVGDAVRAARYQRDETYRIYEDLMNRFDEDSSIVTGAYNAYLDALGAYNRAVENSNLQTTTAQNEVNRAYNALIQAQNSLDQLLEGASAEDIEAAELDVETATLNLERARNDLEKATLVAPFDGRVAAINIAAGEAAPTGMPALTLIDTSQFYLTVGVDEMDIGRLEIGQPAEITLDSFPENIINGHVERVAPVANLEGGVVYYDVTISLEPSDTPVRVDMTANATIIIEEMTDILTIPTWVVRLDPTTGQTYVNQQINGRIERTDIQLGIRYEGTAEVLSGLTEGEEIVWMPDSFFDFN